MAIENKNILFRFNHMYFENQFLPLFSLLGLSSDLYITWLKYLTQVFYTEDTKVNLALSGKKIQLSERKLPQVGIKLLDYNTFPKLDYRYYFIPPALHR